MQMFLDDLPIWGFIGRAQKVAGGVAYYLFTHIHFDVLFNGDRVIEVNVATDPHRTVDISDDKPVSVDFTYSVKWRETNVTFDRRMEKYQRYAVNKHHLEVGRVCWLREGGDCKHEREGASPIARL